MNAMTFMLVYAVIGQDSLRLIQGSQAVLKKWSRSTIVAIVSLTQLLFNLVLMIWSCPLFDVKETILKYYQNYGRY